MSWIVLNPFLLNHPKYSSYIVRVAYLVDIPNIFYTLDEVFPESILDYTVYDYKLNKDYLVSIVVRYHVS